MDYDSVKTPPDMNCFMLMDFEYVKTPPDTNCFMSTDYGLEYCFCLITYFSKCHLFIVLLSLNVYFIMLNCIHNSFLFIDYCTCYLVNSILNVILKPIFFSLITNHLLFLPVIFSVLLTSTVKVILKLFFFSLKSSQTFFLQLFGHLNVSFVNVKYLKTITVLRAFKYRLFLPVYCIYLMILFMKIFSSTLWAFKCFLFLYLYFVFYFNLSLCICT